VKIHGAPVRQGGEEIADHRRGRLGPLDHPRPEGLAEGLRVAHQHLEQVLDDPPALDVHPRHDGVAVHPLMEESGEGMVRLSRLVGQLDERLIEGP